MLYSNFSSVRDRRFPQPSNVYRMEFYVIAYVNIIHWERGQSAGKRHMDFFSETKERLLLYDIHMVVHVMWYKTGLTSRVYPSGSASYFVSEISCCDAPLLLAET